MIGGRATAEGTKRRAGGRPGYRLLGPTGLSVSIVGFGGYRTGRSDPGHRAALRAALEAGVNLIDTSSNYMLGDSERLVGEVLAEGIVPRDEVVVVSKVGYVQGPNLELAQAREAQGRPFPDMVKYMDGCWHCIGPEFIEDQLGRALNRLGLETIDVLLLHNPEYFLGDATHHSPPAPLDETRDAFYDRLERAFDYLEQAVADGRIGAYGVSSNSCVAPADAADTTSVARMHDASQGRLAVLQLPYNLLESGALLERNTPGRPAPAGEPRADAEQARTALEAVVERGLGVLVNRPLNAMGPRGGLLRLIDPPPASAAAGDEALRARLAELGQREALLSEIFPGGHPPRAAELLAHHWDDVRTERGFAHFVRGDLLTDAHRGLYDLVASVNRQPTPLQAEKLQAYRHELNELLERLQDRAQQESSRGGAASIRAALEPHLSLELQRESLARLAMDFVVSSPGVTSVLNGMRDVAYVADAVGVLSLPPIADVEGVARALGQQT